MESSNVDIVIELLQKLKTIEEENARKKEAKRAYAKAYYERTKDKKYPKDPVTGERLYGPRGPYNKSPIKEV